MALQSIYSLKVNKGSLEFKNVTFGYSKLSDPFIKNFSISIVPGKIIAFVDERGCGKSTIAKYR